MNPYHDLYNQLQKTPIQQIPGKFTLKRHLISAALAILTCGFLLIGLLILLDSSNHIASIPSMFIGGTFLAATIINVKRR